MMNRLMPRLELLRFGASFTVLTLGLAATASAQSRTYTSDADFDEGTLLNVNHDAPNNDQLQLGSEGSSLSILSVACGGTGTVVRIDTETCEVAGEYLSSPTGYDRDPSRATVDLFGNTWVGNRLEDGLRGQTFGSVVKVGVVMGGTRVNADGTPNPNGEYLAPPFTYSTAVDRDGDGLIRTSRGLGDVLDWPNLTDGLGGMDARVEDCVDETILVFQRTTPERIRHLSIDGSNNLWAGGYPTFPTSFDYIDGETGQVLSNLSAIPPGCGGYAGVVDAAGVLWSTSELEGQVIRYDGVNPAICIDVQNNVRGIAVAANGDIWTAGGTRLARISPDGSVVNIIPVPGASQLHGIAIHPTDGSLWVASSGTNEVVRLDANGVVVTAVATGVQSRGVAVDKDGFVWVANQGDDSVQRIDPSTNAVDKTIALRPGSSPYNPSDMTGVVAGETSLQSGTWQVTRDGGIENVSWSDISWNDSIPEGASLQVFARASNALGSLSGEPWVATNNGAALALTGRHLEVRVDFTYSALNGQSPILFDLTVAGQGPVQDCPPVNRRRAGSLLVFPEFDNDSGSCTVLTLTNTDYGQLGSLAVEFVYINGDTCEEFNRVEHLTPNDTITLITKDHNPQHDRGFVYAFAKDPQTGDPVVANSLIGNVLIISGGFSFGLQAVEYSINALAFEGIGIGGLTDVDDDGLRDLNGVEYEMAPDAIHIPRFFGQVPQNGESSSNYFHSSLILLALSGGSRFTTTVDFLVYNDNEEVFSTEHTFECWEKTSLLEISNVFSQNFLANGTNHDPNEVLGATYVETGWMRIDGGEASSTSTTIQDPAFYAILIERIGSRGGADLPFEHCTQAGVLLPRDLAGGQ